jgi:hypothetical protein
MRVSTALILVPCAMLAQTPPPEVDQALRARVNEFFQYHVVGNYRKAFDLVAEDTKDYYFATQKVLFKSFKILSIRYSDNFTKAEVDLTGDRVMKPRPEFPEYIMTESMKTTWKMEDGKWVWYDLTRPTWITAMGPSDIEALSRSSASPGSMPDLGPKAMQERANAIMQGSSLDKTELILPLDKSSSEQIVFHNGQPGTIKLILDASAKPAGLTAELDKSDVSAGQNAVIKIHFDPKDAAAAPPGFTLRLIMEPFDRVFPIAVKFGVRQPGP